MGGIVGAFRPQPSHSFALDMLLSKRKIVQSSAGNRFAGIVVHLFLRKRRFHVQARIGNSDTRHLLR
jgi:hypothetical protein